MTGGTLKLKKLRKNSDYAIAGFNRRETLDYSYLNASTGFLVATFQL